VKGRRFCDATDVIKNATGDLERLLQNEIQQCFQDFTVAGRSVSLHKETILKEM
jgi:hypothetical protein